MLYYPKINNLALEIGFLKIHWYGLMYLLSFIIIKTLINKNLNNINNKCNIVDISGECIYFGVIGTIVGGRLGYVLLYNFYQYIKYPWSILRIWEGGMSFHGGLIGVIIGLFLFAKKNNISILSVYDCIAPAVPLGLFLGRIGNFINSELWGRVTTVPWGMISENGGLLPRHPSQLYEAFGEGIILYIIMWIYTKKLHPQGAVSGLFLLSYGIIRFFCEFYRAPDSHIGFMLNKFTMGQLLSIPMIIIGCVMMLWTHKRKI